MTFKLYPDARCFAVAARIRLPRPGGMVRVGERVALKRIGGQGVAPVIKMKRRCFYVVGAFTFVVERTRGGGFTVAWVPSS